MNAIMLGIADQNLDLRTQLGNGSPSLDVLLGGPGGVNPSYARQQAGYGRRPSLSLRPDVRLALAGATGGKGQRPPHEPKGNV